jgi:hypothetical protein
MVTLKRVRELIFGTPLDPLDARVRHAIAVTPLLVWVGLGADGLSSSCYGPEEAFVALGQHTHLWLVNLLVASSGASSELADTAMSSRSQPVCW